MKAQARSKTPVKAKIGPNNGNFDGVEKINSALEKWILPIDQIKPDPKNPRTHPPRNLEAIKNSLNTFGQQTPIVVTKDKITIKGNGTYEAALSLGWRKIAAIPTDLANKKLLTGYKVADNKTGDLADWDYQILAEEIKEFVDLDWKGLGWEQWELEPMLGADWAPPEIKEGESSGVDMVSIKVTADQKAIIDQGIEKCRSQSDQPEMSEGRALELIVGDYLSG